MWSKQIKKTCSVSTIGLSGTKTTCKGWQQIHSSATISVCMFVLILLHDHFIHSANNSYYSENQYNEANVYRKKNNIKKLCRLFLRDKHSWKKEIFCLAYADFSRSFQCHASNLMKLRHFVYLLFLLFFDFTKSKNFAFSSVIKNESCLKHTFFFPCKIPLAMKPPLKLRSWKELSGLVCCYILV